MEDDCLIDYADFADFLCDTLLFVWKKFAISPNFHKQGWQNHPDKGHVQEGVFKDLVQKYFGNVYLINFIIDRGFHNHDYFIEFQKECLKAYDTLSYHDVNLAHDRFCHLACELRQMTFHGCRHDLCRNIDCPENI